MTDMEMAVAQVMELANENLNSSKFTKQESLEMWEKLAHQAHMVEQSLAEALDDSEDGPQVTHDDDDVVDPDDHSEEEG